MDFKKFFKNKWNILGLVLAVFVIGGAIAVFSGYLPASMNPANLPNSGYPAVK
jgi:hypothetical protein